MTALGMVLLVLGALVATAEAHYPAHGVAGGVGVLAMALGAVLAISGLGAGLALGLLSGVALAGRRRRRAAALGAEAALPCASAGCAPAPRDSSARSASCAAGLRTAAAWPCTARSGGRGARSASTTKRTTGTALHAGDRVVVERLSGLTLSVRPAEKWELLLMVIAIVIVLAVLLVVGLTALASSVRVLREYERGVVFRLGPADGAARARPAAARSPRLTGWCASACGRSR